MQTTTTSRALSVRMQNAIDAIQAMKATFESNIDMLIDQTEQELVDSTIDLFATSVTDLENEISAQFKMLRAETGIEFEFMPAR